jgi:DNA processing protein
VRPIVELSLSELPGGADLSEPPGAVYVVGEIPRGPRVAIVGTRHPSSEGERYAESLARDIASRGVCVVSGGAKGIDIAAHRGALDAGGTTVVVGPSSFDRPYPEAHRSVFERAVDTGGAYVSRHRVGVAPHTAQFFARNALLVAISHLVVVVETAVRGGARNAAKMARRIGRPVLVVPGAPWCPTALGCIAELRAGAEPVGSARDIMKKLAARRLHAIPTGVQPSLPLWELPGPNEAAADFANDSGSMSTRERVVAVLRDGPVHVDEICLRTRLPIGQVRELLLTLTLEGALATLPAGKVSLVSG